MRTTSTIAVVLCASLLAYAEDDGRTPEQRAKAAKTERDAKKGALRRKADPSKDLEHQQKQLVKLRKNAEGNRQAGNRVGAWAAERDARKVEKAIRQDKERLEAGTSPAGKAGEAERAK